jgi:hypothetical protein
MPANLPDLRIATGPGAEYEVRDPRTGAAIDAHRHRIPFLHQ